MLFVTNAHSHPTQAFVGEYLYAFMTYYVYLHVMTVPNRVTTWWYGFAYGLSTFPAEVAIGPISGAVMNPAVTLAAAFVSAASWGAQHFGNVWLYCVASVAASLTGVCAFYATSPRKKALRSLAVAKFWWRHNLHKIACEFVGTFLLAFISVTASYAAGFGLVSLIHAAYYISGAHLNPVVTAVAYVRGSLPGRFAVAVVAAQLVAGILAAPAANFISNTPIRIHFHDEAKVRRKKFVADGVLVVSSCSSMTIFRMTLRTGCRSPVCSRHGQLKHCGHSFLCTQSWSCAPQG
jgi:glycerol uptake facilitator-like aquaporin